MDAASPSNTTDQSTTVLTKFLGLTCSFHPDEIGPLTEKVIRDYNIPFIHWMYNWELGNPAGNPDFMNDPVAMYAYATKIREHMENSPFDAFFMLDVEPFTLGADFYLFSLSVMRAVRPLGKHSVYHLPNSALPFFPMEALDYVTVSPYIGPWTWQRVEFIQTYIIPKARRLRKIVLACTWHRRQEKGGAAGHGDHLDAAEAWEQENAIRACGATVMSPWSKSEEKKRLPDPWEDQHFAHYLEHLARVRGLVIQDPTDPPITDPDPVLPPPDNTDDTDQPDHQDEHDAE